MRRGFIGWVLVVLLAACQQTLTADVTRFANFPPDRSGQTVAVVPDKDQVGSLEFQNYAQFVANALQTVGLRPLPVSAEGGQADLVATIRYGYRGSDTQYWSDLSWGGWYGRSWWDGYYDGTLNAYTRYSHFLTVRLFDGPAWRRGERRGVFEGRAVSDSAVRPLNPVMPYLVRALFTNFPGVSGQTVRVCVPMGEG